MTAPDGNPVAQVLELTRAALAACEVALTAVGRLHSSAPSVGATSHPADVPLLLHVAEAATLLSCDRATVQRMCRSGQLPSVRLGETGKALRIPRAALVDWIDTQTQERGRGATPPRPLTLGRLRRAR